MKNLLLILTASFSPLFSTVHESLDTSHLIECAFSKNHHNRIMVTGEKIKKIIYPEERVFIQLDSDSGQAFLHYKNCTDQSTVTLSLITESSKVQDIQISFEDKASEVLILGNAQEKPLEVSLTEENFSDYIKGLIKALKTNEIPPGYVSESFKNVTWCPSWNLQTNLTGVLKGKYTLYIYRVTNISKKTLEVPENAFAFKNVKWIYADYRKLPPGKSTILITAEAND